eukprot:GCRY01001423.1.p1 GENE.GCRY01001423.1~~GCRY01001423.1.p1  ORF type:complete len:236 (+),score=44.70 GCRY01001423.1:153-860(+)
MAEQYSFSLTTFSPSGKLNQIEYALARVQTSAMSLGIKATNGVVIAAERKQDTSLMIPEHVKKMSVLSDGIGTVYSGMGADNRLLVTKARKSVEEYYQIYRESMPPTQLVKQIASVMQKYTQSGGVRPFGVSMLVAGLERGRPCLFQVDPSGSFWEWKAAAIGNNMANAKTFLEKRYSEEMELEDAIHTALLTLKEGFNGKITEENIELGVVREDGRFYVLSPSEIKDYLLEADN